jgi:hypothetical protein
MIFFHDDPSPVMPEAGNKKDPVQTGGVQIDPQLCEINACDDLRPLLQGLFSMSRAWRSGRSFR